MDEATQARLLALLGDEDENGCRLWRGSMLSNGYGRFNWNYGYLLAHRAVYEHFKGTIPEGLTIDHLCKVTQCVNPKHLEAVTPRENLLRSNAPNAVAIRTSRCLRGHLRTPENLYASPSSPTMKRCIECKREQARQWRERQRQKRHVA